MVDASCVVDHVQQGNQLGHFDSLHDGGIHQLYDTSERVLTCLHLVTGWVSSARPCLGCECCVRIPSMLLVPSNESSLFPVEADEAARFGNFPPL